MAWGAHPAPYRGLQLAPGARCCGDGCCRAALAPPAPGAASGHEQNQALTFRPGLQDPGSARAPVRSLPGLWCAQWTIAFGVSGFDAAKAPASTGGVGGGAPAAESLPTRHRRLLRGSPLACCLVSPCWPVPHPFHHPSAHGLAEHLPHALWVGWPPQTLLHIALCLHTGPRRSY